MEKNVTTSALEQHYKYRGYSVGFVAGIYNDNTQDETTKQSKQIESKYRLKFPHPEKKE